MSTVRPGEGGVGRWWSAPANWSVRTRLLVVLVVPSVIAVVMAGLRIVDQLGEAAEVDRVARYAGVQGEVAELVENLQRERFKAVQFVSMGRTADPSMLNPSRRDVDSVVGGVRAGVDGLSRDDELLVVVHQEAQQGLGQLPDLRAAVLDPKVPIASLISRYTALIQQLIQLDRTLMRGIDIPDASALSAGLNGLSEARNEATLQLAIVTAASRGLQPPTGALAGLPASDARLTEALRSSRLALDPAQRVRYTELIAGPTNTARFRLVNDLTGPQARPLGIAPQATSTYDGFLAELDATESAMRNELNATTAIQRQRATDGAMLGSALLILALLGGFVMVSLVARKLLTSLRVLRRSTLDIADRRLPDAIARMRTGAVPDVRVDPVPITSREEIGEVARAFDAVHTQALRLATEQVGLQKRVNSMFVNLSRRSQMLVDRQLQLIEGLEQDEQDPDQLSYLFRLDHLATRLRRINENLLVLAGSDLAASSAQPVPLVEVLQAAISEMEQYERVVVHPPPPAHVLGHAAGDLQHLLAELLDNATSYSPPELPVRVDSRTTTDGSVVIEIVDEGIGMSEDKIAATNRLLAAASHPTITAARNMGLYVTGQLALRHRVGVRLVSRGPQPSRSGVAGAAGLTALVTIPRGLIAPARHQLVDPPGLPRPGGTRTEREPGLTRPRPVTPVHPAPDVVVPGARSRVDRRADLVPVPAAHRASSHARTPGDPIDDEAPTDWFHAYRSVPINWQERPESSSVFAWSEPDESLNRDPDAVRARLARYQGSVFRSGGRHEASE